MDRLYWSSTLLDDSEDFINISANVRLYDGDEKKTPYDDGNLVITSHRMIWSDTADEKVCLALDLSQISSISDEAPAFFSSGKIIVHLLTKSQSAKRGPTSNSSYNHIRWSFPKGSHTECLKLLRDAYHKKAWEKQKAVAGTVGKPGGSALPAPILKTGIAGIERKLQEQQRKTDSTINEAFEDLNALMAKAKEMVNISKSIASKIEQKQGNITEDETIKFKSYLLSLGIPDPVTRDSHKSNTSYIQELARQICHILQQPIKDSGGVMALTDVYCRINRARGIELLSPQDLYNACSALPSLDLPLTLKQYESGVMVLQLRSNDEDSVAMETAVAVEKHTSLSADELASIIGLLLLAERKGKLCRDDTVEGLRFYSNLFLTKTT